MASRRTRRTAYVKRRLVRAAAVVLTLHTFFTFLSRSVPLERQSKPFLGVCVTGQLCRLELESKIKSFILPSSKIYNVHVHFELEESECKFTNNQNSTSLGGRLNSFFDIETNFGKYFKYFDISSRNDINISHRASSSRHSLSISYASSLLGEPVIQYRYLYSLNKLGHVNETLRAMNHWRQWKTNHNCLHALDAIGYFNLYVRIREDLLFHNMFVPQLVWLNQTEHDMWVPRCASWHGFNDKIAIIHSRARESYFMRVLATYEDNYDDVTCSHDHRVCRYTFQTKNPEMFLKQALTNANVRVQQLAPEVLPTFTGEHKNGTYFCFPSYKRQLGEGLDCLPSKDRQTFKPPCHNFVV